MKRISVILFLFSITTIASAQREVSQERMAEIYEQVKTPYKYGMVLAPETNDYKIDCPTVFRYGDKWYMTYLIYNGRTGKDGRGYETWLAESDNLLRWTTKGRILSFRNNTWDSNQRGGFPALPDMEWGGNYRLQSWKGNYWMTYIGGANAGYESGPLSIGLAWTKEKNLGQAVEWEASDKPILSSDTKDAQWFENLTEYKSTVYWDKSQTLGYPFVLFYNAGGRHPETNLKGERVGIALSKDMKKWKRYEGNPVFAHETEGTITGDAHIQKFGDVYVMFYFSAFNPTRRYKAFNTFACSYDLVHWTDWQGEDLIVPSEDYDNLFAHKSYVINHNGVVYHFYCATNKYEQRGIAVATSKPKGRSEVRFPAPEVKSQRTVIELNEGWKTYLISPDSLKGKERTVNIPHNWDDYFGYRQLTHGNLHGTAMYIKTFTVPQLEQGKRYFLRFEGVGTYAAIRLNGKDYGRHPIGRTSLTLDISDAIKGGEQGNLLEIKAEHPEMISDMPWVCGGCSSEWGFSEGSQPLGIFRPIVFETTDEIRIEPFGVHIWNDDKASTIYINTEIKNYGSTTKNIEVVNRLNNEDGKQVLRLSESITLAPGETRVIRQSSPIENPILWDTQNPYLYELISMIKRGEETTDKTTTPFGIRTISFPVKRNDNDGRFYLNGKPVFINGVCEYEHQFGQSHAFSHEQIAARVKQVRSAGFNAFRDAHQPHNLDYQKHWDKEGVLFWTQFSAHVWYDTPEFRENFKSLLRQWIKERRNSPSVIMWGLQNESTLPSAFAQECCEIIREMDPTARNMRIITTCNGGEGTDWNVIQNWSGTYGGTPQNYHHELARKDQLLNGEYGAWRSLGLHTEPTGEFQQEGVWSEERICQLLEMKIRLAEEVRDSVCGHFQWLYSSHDNPGRRQPDEAYRTIDKVGPFNYKGLVSPWEEPSDVYYMYRANYVSPAKDPMVYLVSHTWSDRFSSGRRRATIEAYSNCDSVLLYNDAIDNIFLGRKRNAGTGTHFVWENRDIHYNVLRAVGYYKGKPVAEDLIVLNGLEEAPHFEALYQDVQPILKAEQGYNYLYRINCGGDTYTDEYGQTWAQDNTSVSHSWAESFKELNPYLASQRRTNDPIRGTRDWELFQSFRFGRHELEYHFPVPDGRYRVELYFTEPWHGTGGGTKTNCAGLRIFDVAINGSTVINDLDLWAESGHDVAYKKVIDTTIKGGKLIVHFPQVNAGQAVISAIAIATVDTTLQPIQTQTAMNWSWKKADKEVLEKTPQELLPKDKNTRTNITYEAETANVKGKYFKKEHRKQTGIFFEKGEKNSIEWNISTGLAQVYALRFKYINTSNHPITVHIQLIDKAGSVLKDSEITFPEAPDKWRMISTTTGTFVNAGHYRVVISTKDMEGLAFDALDIQ
ncbi:Beta-galactosidase BoGH2A [termite gut metagenome]|uniref:Beta-galactosidase BoGH2A n=1 Tax=termite gut metagenome TaxID=433724 RepID=A0A5J4SFT4_9ZZZZ